LFDEERAGGRSDEISNDIVHVVDLYTTLAHVGGAEVPKDRAIDGIDQPDFFLGSKNCASLRSACNAESPAAASTPTRN
jgi:hypothetical protein